MGALRTIGKWVGFLLFAGCMGGSLICSVVAIPDESGFKIFLSIFAAILAVLNCVLYLKKLDKDNKLFAGIGCLILLGLQIFLATTTESSPHGIGAICAGIGIVFCFTVNAFNKLADFLAG